MSAYVPLKLTEEERDLLDWLVHERPYASRSDVLREALVNIASDANAPRRLIQEARCSRRETGLRASRTVARRRRVGDDAPRTQE